MIRKRLTARMNTAEDSEKFSGNVGQENRPTVDIRKYDNYVEVPGWETQDMNHDWKANPRDEVGMGVPRIAAIYATSQQAVRLATLFLGDKVKESMIEAQARDFMRLGSRRIQAALERFNTSSTLYAEEETAPAAPAVPAEAPAAVVAPVVAAPVAAPAAPVVAEVSAPAVVPAPAAPVATDLVELPVQTPVVPTTPTAEDDGAIDLEDDAPVAADEDDGLAVEMGEELDMTDENVDDTEIASVFADEQMDTAIGDDDDSNVEVAKLKTSSKKAGIKKLGGQPKVVTAKVNNVADLSSVWSDAPDVTSIF